MATMLRAGVLAFRHPLLKGKDGYPKSVQRGIVKFAPTESEQQEALEQIERLIELAPKSWVDIPADLEINRAAFNAYFATLHGGKWHHLWQAFITHKAGRAAAPREESEALRQRNVELERELGEARKQIASLVETVARLTKPEMSMGTPEPKRKAKVASK